MKLIPIAGDLALPGWHALRTVPFGESWALAGHATDRHPSFVRATCRAAFASFFGTANRPQSAPVAHVASIRAAGGISPREIRLATYWTIGALGVLGGLVFGTSRSNEKPLENAVPMQPAVSGAKPLAALASVTTPGASLTTPEESRKASPTASIQPETPSPAAPVKKAPAHTPSHAMPHHATPRHAATAKHKHKHKQNYEIPLAGKAPATKQAHKTTQAPRAAAPKVDARVAHDRDALRAQRWREIGAMQRFAPHRAAALPTPAPVNAVSDGKLGTPNLDPAATRAYAHPVSHAHLAQTSRAQEPLVPLRSETPAILVATPGTSAPVAMPAAAKTAAGHIEIVIGKATIRIEGDVDPAVLRQVLAALPA
ncbi:hypothetical protein AB4851_19995 [Burkholderia sp. 22PA0099]|uniref:hypothetical protein n=1 Tax=Burkholderia sp. 22PA0099 TaxID=3237372 RepID=UPI0039C43E02